MHFNRTLGPLTVKGDLRALVAGIILLGLLINLGSWQLARATEKSALVDRWEARAALPAVHPKTLSTEPPESLADRQVTWRGLFQAEDYLLLDNRIHQGRVGYHVVALVSAEDELVPVNLGWLAGDPSRRTEPTPVLPEGLVSVSGRVYVPTGTPLMMQKPEAPALLPATVQTLYWDDWQRSLSTLTGRAVYPFEVRVDQRSPLAFVAEWPIVNQSPAKHIGYAIQWFAMAAVLVFIGVWRLTNLGAILTRRASP